MPRIKPLLLRDCQDIVGYPIDQQTRRKWCHDEHHHPRHYRKHLLLNWISRSRVELELEIHCNTKQNCKHANTEESRDSEGQHAKQVEDVRGVWRGQILDPQHKRLMPHFDGDHQNLVKRIENRNLNEDRQTARHRVDLFSLIKTHHLLLQFGLVILVTLLQRLDFGLYDAHRGHARKLALRDWVHDAAHNERQQHDRNTEIAHHPKQPIKQIKERLGKHFKPAPVDCFAEVYDRLAVFITIKQTHFLCASE